MLCLLAILAPVSLLVSDLPRRVAWPVAVITLGYGAWLMRRESRKPSHEIVIRDAGARVDIDGVQVDEFLVDWRGVLAFARWRDPQGRVRRLAWWPDTLPADARRELRLAALVETSPRDPASMAP